MRLRVIDFGHVSALRSQAVYHGIAEQMPTNGEPVLTLANPTEPYVCVGVHQEIALEVDEDFCRQRQLPIVRRHVGGGTVFLDANQMFFHFIYPRSQAPIRAEQLYPMFIQPVVESYREDFWKKAVYASYPPQTTWRRKTSGYRVGWRSFWQWLGERSRRCTFRHS